MTGRLKTALPTVRAAAGAVVVATALLGSGGSCGDGGRLLEFATCGTQNLATYGFSQQTSSWVNNTDAYVTVYDVNDSLLWSESPGYASSYVGSADNDKAASFWLIC